MNRPMKNRKNEIAVLMALDVLHMRYIARDEGGGLYAYATEPEKAWCVDPNGEKYFAKPVTWHDVDGGREYNLEPLDHFFEEVKAEDEEPTKIETLLMNKIREAPVDSYQMILDDIGAMFNRAVKEQDKDIFDEC